MSLEHLNNSDLTTLCQQETNKYRKQHRHTMRYCFELFRRAFTQEDKLALSKIFSLYGSLVRHWVMRHPILPQLDLPAEYFAADSISEFYFAMTKHSFARFDSVAAILAYWRKCVHTVLMQAYRTQQRQVAQLPITAGIFVTQSGHDIENKLLAEQIWQRITTLLNDEDRLLAHFVLVQNLKPQQIVAQPQSRWQTTNHVRIARQRIMRVIKKDAIICQLLQLDN